MAKYSIEDALRELGKDIDNLTQDITNQAKQQVQALAAQAHSMIVSKAQAKLKSTRSIYIDALNLEKIDSSPDNEIWAVTLDKSAKWIEDGQPWHNMIDYLVNGPKHKVGKDGKKYAIIPFKHNKPSSQMSLAQNKIANYVKGELKKRGLDKTITKDGKPVIGRAATLDLTGPKAPTSMNKPLLAGLTIYQREQKTKSGKINIKRDVMTFRVVSENQKGSGMWDKPSKPAMNFFEDTARELDGIWEKIITQIVEKA